MLTNKLLKEFLIKQNWKLSFTMEKQNQDSTKFIRGGISALNLPI